eukprot:Em0840g4a
MSPIPSLGPQNSKGLCGPLTGSNVDTTIGSSCMLSQLTMAAAQNINVSCVDLYTTSPENAVAIVFGTQSGVLSSSLPTGTVCTNSQTVQWTPATGGDIASSYNINVTNTIFGATVGTRSVAGDTNMTSIGDLIDDTRM